MAKENENNENDVNKWNSILRLIGQSLMIGGIVLTMLYFPINSKINALAEKLDNKIIATNSRVNTIKEQHDKDCVQMIEDTKELEEEVQKKLEEAKLKLYLDPLITAVNDMKIQINTFRTEIIQVLKNQK